MAITYTWDCEVNKTQPYNINSSQANIVEQITWTFVGNNGTNQSSIGGMTAFDVTQGVDGSFVAIDTISKSTLEGWVKSTLGDSRVTEMEAEIKSLLDNITGTVNVAPDDTGSGSTYVDDGSI
jgi:hypothetical protein